MPRALYFRNTHLVVPQVLYFRSMARYVLMIPVSLQLGFGLGLSTTFQLALLLLLIIILYCVAHKFNGLTDSSLYSQV